MRCRFTGGAAGRQFDVHYKCQPGAPPSSTASQTGTSAYEVVVSGGAACGAVYTPPLSHGSIFLIAFFVGAVLYVAGGVTYNVKVRARAPTVTDAFPQWEQWRQLPGLVRDGCSFSWEQAQKAYYGVRHGSAPPLDPSLTRRLAEGGAGDTT